MHMNDLVEDNWLSTVVRSGVVQAGRDFSVPAVWIHRQLRRMFWPQERAHHAEAGSQRVLGSDSLERCAVTEVLTVTVGLLTGLLIMSGAVLAAVGAVKLQALVDPDSPYAMLVVVFVDVCAFVLVGLCSIGWIYQHIMVLRGTAARLSQ